MLTALLEELFDLLEHLDPDAVPLCKAPGLWTQLDRAERLLSSAKTLVARRVDESDVWKRAGSRSAAEYMAGRAGTSIGTAKRQLSTSKKVCALPKTAHAMRQGKLSSEKAHAIVDAADVAPEAEDRLLEGAEHKPLAELRDDCLKSKAKDRDKAHARIRRNRYARDFRDSEGAWNMRVRGPLEDGARFRGEWKREIDRQFKLAKAEGREEPLEAYAFDALIALAERAAGTTTDVDEANTTTEPETMTTRTKTKPTPARYLGLIRLDHTAMVRGTVEGEETCEIAGLGPIPVRIARELLGDAVLKLVITKGVDVMNVTHLGRSVTVAQQVALWWQSPTCTRSGCTRTERLENDHREEWHKTKHTRLDESDPLCGHDHRLKTNHGWSLVKGNGRRPMVPPGDPRHPKYRPPQRK